MHPHALQASYAGIRRPIPSLPAAKIMTHESHHAMYQASLAAAAEMDSHSVAASTLHKRHVVFKDFVAFLDLAPPGPNKRTVFNCIPEDVLAYFHAQWLPNHLGSETSSGHIMAAPSSLESAVYTLSTCLQQLGRVKPWDDASTSGNPISMQRITKWLLGYKKQAASQGFPSTGAKELTPGKISALLTHLHRQLLEPSPLHRHIAARDAFAFSFLWVTWCRGITAGQFTAADIQQPDGKPALPLLYPTLMLTPGSTLKITPQRLKTCVAANNEPVFITMQPATCQAQYPVYWLHQRLSTAAICGSSITATGYIVRKLATSHQTISPIPATTSCLAKRLTGHLKAIHSYEGESMHSFRRGRAIADTAASVPDAAMQSKLLLKGSAMLKRNYQPTGRHASGVKRLRSSRQPVAAGGMPSCSLASHWGPPPRARVLRPHPCLSPYMLPQPVQQAGPWVVLST